MTAKTAYIKLSQMLGLSTEVKFAEATLVDGTVVKTEGDLVEGAQLMVVTPEGDIPAPEGMHETAEGLIITVDAAGIIISIEDKGSEEPAEVETPEEAAPVAAEAAFSLEDVANVIKPLVDKIELLNTELESVKASFNAFKEEPAAKKVTTQFAVEKQTEESIAKARLDYLASLRKK